MTWTCKNCGATGNLGDQCRKCMASKPVAKPLSKITATPCRYCHKACGERAYFRQTLFGELKQTLPFCWHCDSWQS